MGLAQILGLAQGQLDILLPGATLWCGRSQGRPEQTVTLSHASLLFSCDTTIYRLWLCTPWLHTHTHTCPHLHRHRNNRCVKNSSSATFYFCNFLIRLGVSSLTERLNRPRGSLQGHQSRTVAERLLGNNAVAWVVVCSAASSSPCTSRLCLWLVAINGSRMTASTGLFFLFFTLWAYGACLVQALLL